MAKVVELDADLANGLKQAKGKRMYFAVVLKGAADGALIVSKQKVPAPAIAEAKKKSGGSAVIKGACFGEEGKHIFEVAKEPPATLANTLKLIAKRDSGLSIHAECRVGSDPDLVDEEDAKATSGAKPTTTTKPTGQQTTQKGPLPEAEKYAAALNMWEKASATALSATDKLLSSLQATNDEVGLKIAAIIETMRNDFPDTLDDALTNLAKSAKAGNAADAESYRFKSEIAIKASLAYLGNNAKTIEACENNPFGVIVPFRAALTEALKQVLINVKK